MVALGSASSSPGFSSCHPTCWHLLRSLHPCLSPALWSSASCSHTASITPWELFRATALPASPRTVSCADLGPAQSPGPYQPLHPNWVPIMIVFILEFYFLVIKNRPHMLHTSLNLSFWKVIKFITILQLCSNCNKYVMHYIFVHCIT